MAREKVQFRRGPSDTRPQTKVPGTLLIDNDTGNCWVDDTINKRIKLTDTDKLDVKGGNITGNLEVDGDVIIGGNLIANIETGIQWIDY